MTAAPFSSPIAPASSVPPARPSSRMVQRLGLTLALWLIWLAPLAIIAATVPKFAQIFKEFGVKAGGAELLMLQVGGLLGSPVGLLLMLVALPLLCFAVSALIFPFRAAVTGSVRARWPLAIIAVITSIAGALALCIAFTVVMALTMTMISDKLK